MCAQRHPQKNNLWPICFPADRPPLRPRGGGSSAVVCLTETSPPFSPLTYNPRWSKYRQARALMRWPNPTGMRMLRGPCPPSRAAIHMACLGGWCLQGTTAKTAPGSPWSALGRSKVPILCVSKLRCPPTAKITAFRKTPLAHCMKVFVSLREK